MTASSSVIDRPVVGAALIEAQDKQAAKGKTAKEPKAHPKPSAKVMTVTPEMAREWLDRSATQRKLRMAEVRAAARDMTTGDFDLNGETLKFDWNGRFRDGQHRLESCILSGKPFDTFVVFDLNPKALKSVDIGSRRTPGEILGMNLGEFGMTRPFNQTVLAGIAGWAVNWDAGIMTGKGALRMSPAEMVNYLTDNPLLFSAATYGVNARVVYDDISTNIWGMAWWLLSRRGERPALCESFFQSVQSGLGLNDPEHPAVYIREELRVTERPRRRRNGDDPDKKLSRYQKLALLINGWNAWIARQSGQVVPSMKIPRVLTNESFPRPIGLVPAGQNEQE